MVCTASLVELILKRLLVAPSMSKLHLYFFSFGAKQWSNTVKPLILATLNLAFESI